MLLIDGVRQALGLATVRKTPPKLELGSVRGQADSRTLEALISNRYEVMAQYAKHVRGVCAGELAKLRSQGLSHGVRGVNLKLARRLPLVPVSKTAAARAA